MRLLRIALPFLLFFSFSAFCAERAPADPHPWDAMDVSKFVTGIERGFRKTDWRTVKEDGFWKLRKNPKSDLGYLEFWDGLAYMPSPTSEVEAPERRAEEWLIEAMSKTFEARAAFHLNKNSAAINAYLETHAEISPYKIPREAGLNNYILGEAILTRRELTLYFSGGARRDDPYEPLKTKARWIPQDLRHLRLLLKGDVPHSDVTYLSATGLSIPHDKLGGVEAGIMNSFYRSQDTNQPHLLFPTFLCDHFSIGFYRELLLTRFNPGLYALCPDCFPRVKLMDAIYQKAFDDPRFKELQISSFTEGLFKDVTLAQTNRQALVDQIAIAARTGADADLIPSLFDLYMLDRPSRIELRADIHGDLPQLPEIFDDLTAPSTCTGEIIPAAKTPGKRQRRSTSR